MTAEGWRVLAVTRMYSGRESLERAAELNTVGGREMAACIAVEELRAGTVFACAWLAAVCLPPEPKSGRSLLGVA